MRGVYGGGVFLNEGLIRVKNSLIANNKGQSPGGTFDDDCGALALTSEGYNIISPSYECLFNGDLTGVTNVDPKVGTFSDGGGFAQTLPLLVDSPAIGKIPPDRCTDTVAAPLKADQRGYTRIGNCDIGAYQYNGARQPNHPLNTNLLINADFELGVGSAKVNTIVGAPYWALEQGQPSSVQYGTEGFPTLTDAPSDGGVNFFAGGNAALSSSYQVLDISALASQIDTGRVEIDIAGLFGGYAESTDQATLRTIFRPSRFAGEISHLDLTGGDFNSRQGQTTLVSPAPLHGVVPAGTRIIVLQLFSTRGSGTYNDGYADNLSVVLSSSPLPVYIPIIQR